MFIYKYLIIFTNLFGEYGKSNLGFEDNVALSGGIFLREVYSEGLKRRWKALHPPSAGKMNCNIQWLCLFMNI